MKIFLVGMPGSGKSTIGQQLSRSLSMEFVDLDKEIEVAEGMSIKEIFTTHGEAHFRLAESNMLKLLAGKMESFVMATGGGTPCFHDGMKIINSNGLSIFIDESIATLLDRLKHKVDRPLLHTADLNEMKEKLETTRATRLSCYEKASITVKSATLSKVMEAINLRK